MLFIINMLFFFITNEIQLFHNFILIGSEKVPVVGIV